QPGTIVAVRLLRQVLDTQRPDTGHAGLGLARAERRRQRHRPVAGSAALRGRHRLLAVCRPGFSLVAVGQAGSYLARHLLRQPRGAATQEHSQEVALSRCKKAGSLNRLFHFQRPAQPARRSSQTPANAQMPAGTSTASSGEKPNTMLEGPSRSWAI